MTTETLTRREKQQRTRKSLLGAAAKLFCKRGLEGASIDEVAQAAGYTKGAFYANFKSKEELFLVMLDERFASELDRLDRALAGTQQPEDEARAAAIDFVHFAGDEDWPKLYFQFVARAARNDDFREELATRHRAMRAQMSEILERWKRGTGHQPPIPDGGRHRDDVVHGRRVPRRPDRRAGPQRGPLRVDHDRVPPGAEGDGDRPGGRGGRRLPLSYAAAVEAPTSAYTSPSKPSEASTAGRSKNGSTCVRKVPATPVLRSIQ